MEFKIGETWRKRRDGGGVTDENMQKMIAKTAPYTIVILHRTPKREESGADAIVWEHGRRSFERRRDGKLSIVCPVSDENDVSGPCIFSTDAAGTNEIMDEDPAVKAGIFTYEVHATRSFPGDFLP